MSCETEIGQNAGRHTMAANWFARLRMADCTEIERAAFKRWLGESADNAAAYRHAERIWASSAKLRDDPAIAAATREALHARVSPPRRPGARRRWRWPAAASAAAMAAALVLVLMPRFTDVRPADWAPVAWSGERFSTVTGQQRSITLTDGSQVVLDAESVLRVRYDDHVRNLVLEKGQAQFKVAHNAQRPFIVRAADGAVRAIGTEFQVRVDGKAVTVTLLEGKVSVDVPGGILRPARSETLVAGQQVRFNARKDEIDKHPADLEVAKSWTHGELVFKRWPLDALVAEMNRHADTKVVIEDPSLRTLRVNGRFHAGDQQSLILALQLQWAIQARQVGEHEIALSRDPAVALPASASPAS